MRTRIVLCICITLLVAGSLHAATRTFTGAVDQFWSNAGNWDAIPGVNDKARVRSEKPCILDYDAPVIQQYVGEGGTIGHLILIDGAQLSVRTWSIIGYNGGEPDARHTIEVLGGVYNAGHPDWPGENGRLYVGREGYARLIIGYTGVVNVLHQAFQVGSGNGGDGIVEIRGGELNLNGGNLNIETGELESLIFRAGVNSKASMDFSGGVMTQAYSDARLAYINDHIADGTITAYGGVGEVVMDTDETPGTLAVRGLHPLKPFPSDDGLATPGAVELSWTLPDPNVAGQPVPVDVYFTDDLTALQQFTDPAAMQVVNKQNVTSVVMQTQTKTRYYWAIDTYVDSAAEFPVIGPIFSFIVDNLPPEVDAGNDVVTWLVDGFRTGNLDATVIDQDAYTVQWTVVSEPNEGNAVIETATAEDTSITLAALGEYVLQLEASDGEYTGLDTVMIDVYSDGCEAAKSLSDYEPSPGDLNGDCVVDDLDLAILQEDWLVDTSLTDDWFTVD